MLSGEKLQKALSKLVHYRVNKAHIEELEAHGFISDYEGICYDEGQEAGLVFLAREWKKLNRLDNRPADEQVVRVNTETGLLALRNEALSRILAADAADASRVRAFRESVLSNQLLAPEEVHEWIQSHTQKRNTCYLSEVPLTEPSAVSVPKETSPGKYERVIDPPLALSSISATVAFMTKSLDYVMPGVRWVQGVPTTLGTLLDELRELSEALAEYYGWQAAQATVFVLTGTPPWLVLFTKEIRGGDNFPATTRITLTIDPTLSPEEVAKRYSAVRSSMCGDKRYTPVEEKSLRLAMFMVGRQYGAWLKQMREWNATCVEHPEWIYTEGTEQSFGRDCRAARQRLLYRNYKWSPKEYQP